MFSIQHILSASCVPLSRDVRNREAYKNSTDRSKRGKVIKKRWYIGEKIMHDKKVQSVKEIDFSDLVLPMIAVYKNPEDYPNDCVARVFDLERPTNIVIIKKTVREIKEDIEQHMGMVFLNREVADVLSLVGVYL